jgi:hypothetical protein
MEGQMRRFIPLTFVIVAGAAGNGCSSNSGGGGSQCDTVCDCVAGAGGDRSSCMEQCASISKTSTDPSHDCEQAVKANGFNQCEDSCNVFKTTSDLQRFCDKCASCVGEAGFDEGFCNPFKTSIGFDTSSCAKNGDRAQLANPSITASQLSGMSCTDFDNAE